MLIRPRQRVRPWLASVAVLATVVVLTGCASRDQQKANSVEADPVPGVSSRGTSLSVAAPDSRDDHG